MKKKAIKISLPRKMIARWNRIKWFLTAENRSFRCFRASIYDVSIFRGKLWHNATKNFQGRVSSCQGSMQCTLTIDILINQNLCIPHRHIERLKCKMKMNEEEVSKMVQKSISFDVLQAYIVGRQLKIAADVGMCMFIAWWVVERQIE